MTVRWITPLLGTANAAWVRDLLDVHIVDVRDLVDKAGNRADAIREKIDQGVKFLTEGKKTVVCCDYGISRSNAVAAGILATYGNVSFDVAVRQVLKATEDAEIKLGPLNAVRAALGSEHTKPREIEGRSILVTGSSGFLGAAICSRINGEFQLVTPPRDQLDIEQGSTQLDLLVGEGNVDCIIHLANPKVHTSNIALGKTLTMLRNVLDVCAARDVPLIYPSNWELYSGYAGHLRVDEAVPAYPQGPYGETKYLAELMIEHCSRTRGLRCAVLRASTVYGSGGVKPKFIYNFIDKARRGEVIVTHRYRNGDPALDLLHVDDLVSAILAAVKHGFVGVLNLGTGTVTSTREIAEMLKIMLGSSSRIEQAGIDTYTACIAMDCRRAQAELGWQPTVSLEPGLRRLLSDIG